MTHEAPPTARIACISNIWEIGSIDATYLDPRLTVHYRRLKEMIKKMISLTPEVARLRSVKPLSLATCALP
jgi:hypothetical protein